MDPYKPVHVPEDGVVHTPYKPIRLKKGQIEHVDKAVEILKNSRYFIDKSQPGSGKTHTTAAILALTGAAVIHIGPATTLTYTTRVYENAGIPVFGMMSFDTFAGKIAKDGKGGIKGHPFLMRTDREFIKIVKTKKGDKEVKEKITEYSPTPTLKHLMTEGYTDDQGEHHPVYIVVDESQRLKNENLSGAAIGALCRYAVNNVPDFRAIFLSGSLMDNQKNAKNLLRAMGIITKAKLYEKKPGLPIVYKGYGMQELIDLCYSLNPESQERCNYILTTPETVDAEGNKLSENAIVDGLIFRILATILLPLISLSMEPQDDTEFLAYDAYFDTDFDSYTNLRHWISELRSAARYREDGSVGSGQDWGRITKCIIQIETLKMYAMIPHFQAYLDRNPTHKIVILCNYLNLVDLVQDRLAGYGVIEITGRISKDQRENNRVAFNEEDRYRVLVGITSVAGQGISIHDTIGDRPRTMFKMPSFYYLLQEQSGRRIFRVGVKSRATVYTMYIRYQDYLTEETNIMNALARKKDVLIQVMPEFYDKNSKLPGNYPVIKVYDDGEHVPVKMTKTSEGINVVEIQDSEPVVSSTATGLTTQGNVGNWSDLPLGSDWMSRPLRRGVVDVANWALSRK